MEKMLILALFLALLLTGCGSGSVSGRAERRTLGQETAGQRLSFFSSIGIDKRIATQAKQTIVFTFVPVNSIIVIPFMLRSFNKRKDREITGEQLNKRAVVMFIIAVVIVVSEFFYFRNIEKGIGRIIEQQEAASNTANTTVENLTVENKISNNAVVENSISNTENQVTNDVVSKNMTTK